MEPRSFIYRKRYMELIITRAKPDDWEFIRELRNSSSSGFFSQEEISQQQHAGFMEKYGRKYFVAYNRKEQRVGFIGEVEGDIRFAVPVAFRGHNIAVSMLNFFEGEASDTVLSAKVKSTNYASIKTFLKAGWVKGSVGKWVTNEEYITFEK